MRSTIRLVRRHEISIHELPMNLRVKIGKCCPEDFVKLSHPVFVRANPRQRSVVTEIICEQFIKQSEIPPCRALDRY
jgi:hypothetical protein